MTEGIKTQSLITFDFEEQPIRLHIDEHGEPWWFAVDVCRVLDIDNPRQAITRLDDDERITVTINDGNRGNPEKNVVNESGLYSLIFTSRKPEAKTFKRWVTHEVLPTIRKTGSYHMDGRSVPLSEQTAIKMVELMQQMVVQFGQVHHKLMEVMENNQRKPRRQLVSTWQATRICNYYRSGLSVHEIALKTNIAADTVEGLLDLFEEKQFTEEIEMEGGAQ